jgi:hypothetical protein
LAAGSLLFRLTWFPCCLAGMETAPNIEAAIGKTFYY